MYTVFIGQTSMVDWRTVKNRYRSVFFAFNTNCIVTTTITIRRGFGKYILYIFYNYCIVVIYVKNLWVRFIIIDKRKIYIVKLSLLTRVSNYFYYLYIIYIFLIHVTVTDNTYIRINIANKLHGPRKYYILLFI